MMEMTRLVSKLVHQIIWTSANVFLVVYNVFFNVFLWFSSKILPNELKMPLKTVKTCFHDDTFKVSCIHVMLAEFHVKDTILSLLNCFWVVWPNPELLVAE